MKKTISFLAFTAILSFMVACGNNNAESSVTDDSANEVEAPAETPAETAEPEITVADEPEKVETPAAKANEWDSILDEYESMVDEYIKLMKKASSGDLSAMTEYVKYMEKAQKLADKLSDADDDLTTAQLSRYTKITQKMANAASNL